MDNLAAAGLTKALGHPLRLAYLRALADQGRLSPSDYARQAGEPLGNVSYHVSALRKAGVLEVAETIPRRGAMEHRYSFTGPQAKAAKAVMNVLARQ
jgi:DNA-binding transcriptional ArsR family regulator